jgi:tetratricopeptide (TPR) repeat protein
LAADWKSLKGRSLRRLSLAPLRISSTLSRELLIGNVYLVRDSDPAAALPYFERAIAASGPHTTFARGNAAINAGFCHHMFEQFDAAIEKFKLAEESCKAAGANYKLGVVLHSIGNALRAKGELAEGMWYVEAALYSYEEYRDESGSWVAADDLSRGFLNFGVERPENREKWLELAAIVGYRNVRRRERMEQLC